MLQDQRLGLIAMELENLADRLNSKVRPGHVDYLSKGDAAKWISDIARQIDQHAAQRGDLTSEALIKQGRRLSV